MAPRKGKIASELRDLISDELDTISRFLKISPSSKDKIDYKRFALLDKRERLMRLFLEYFWPKEQLLPEIIEEDLAYLLAYNLLEVVEKEKLIQEWYQKRGLDPIRKDEPFVILEDRTVYRSVNDLLEADSYTFGEFLPLLLKKVRRLRKFIRDTLSYRETIRYLDNLLLSWKPKFSRNDMRVVLCLDANPFNSNKAIAQELNLHENSVTYILNRLRKLFNFGVLGRPNLNKLGLQKVLIKTHNNVSIEFPYLASFQQLRAGTIAKFYSFNIPFQKKPSHPLQELYNVFKESIDEFSIYVELGMKDGLSFQYFDVEENKFDIDWDAWALWLERVLYEEKYYMVSPDSIKISEKEKRRISFDLKDLQILDNYMSNLRMSMKQLGKSVGMTKAGVRYRVKRLLRENAIIPAVLMRQIGLDEQILVLYSGDQEYLYPFEAALFELPVVFSYILKPFPHPSKNVLIAWLQLPPGSFIKFTDTISNIIHESDAIWTAHRYHYRSVSKLLPLEMFDAQKKDWRWDNEILAQLKIET
jgi:hypothetical protein